MRKNRGMKGFAFGIFLLFLGTGFQSALAQKTEQPVLPSVKGNWWYVGGSGPRNYTTIQDAINASSDGDTVFVYDDSSPYRSVVVNKSIHLLGEHTNTTIIDGENKGDAVWIQSERVVLSNFTITHGDGEDLLRDFFRAGVRITASNVTIKHNSIRDNRKGILGLRVTNLTICDNCFFHDGVTLSPYENEGRPAISPEYFDHTIQNNVVNGKPLYYFKNQTQITVPADAGQVIAVNCAQLFLRNASIHEVDDAGMILAFCSACTIEHSSFFDHAMVWLFRSDHTLIQGNTLENNLHGLCLDYGSTANVIQSNTFSQNQMAGVMMEYYSNENRILQNNLMQNDYNSYTKQSFKNRWNENYWHDWLGLQSAILRFFPKLIVGQLFEGHRIPSVNFDWNPASEPYDIT
ncbi:MAG: right-handed parallel beta-helix repeat-containing protein [Candidatus Thermoplasmatota archaeon]